MLGSFLDGVDAPKDDAATAAVPTPEQVRLRERFVNPFGARTPLDATSTLVLNPPLELAVRSADELRRMAAAAAGGGRFFLAVNVEDRRTPVRAHARVCHRQTHVSDARAGSQTVSVLLVEDATSEDFLVAQLAAAHLRRAIAKGGEASTAAAQQSARWAQERRAAMLEALHARGWSTDHLLFEREPVRLRFS